MFRRILYFGILMLVVFGQSVYGGEKLLAFPGAEGFGAFSRGGRGGKVIFVTNLEDYDPAKEAVVPGSLRAACSAKGPRIVLFRVSGTIELKTALKIKEPFITIAGQSAPGDGICLKNYRMQVSTNDVVIRYIRFRPGDNEAGKEGFRGDDIDSLSVTNAVDVIIDHCSASWSVDETLSVTHSDRVTVQWCIISESLNCSAHHKGCHGYGSLVRGERGAGVSYHHNLYAHHNNRCPRPGGHRSSVDDPAGFTFDFRNNVVYNWGKSAAGYNSDGATTPHASVTKMNFVGNYYIPGPNTPREFAFREKCTAAKAYFNDNRMNGELPEDKWSIVSFGKNITEQQRRAYKQPVPFEAAFVTTDGADLAYVRVLGGAGAILPMREAVDVRVVNAVMNKAGGIIDDEQQVGGWPVLKSDELPTDGDNDGMPDEWEAKYGLNPKDGSDCSADTDSDGYTNIEEFLNQTEPDRKTSAWK